MALLSVNINKVATLRNSRGRNNPNLIKMTQHLLKLGVKGITIHPRPDERHIKKTDVPELKNFLSAHPDVEFNIEGYPSGNFVELIQQTLPHQCTLVPDPPHVLTSDAGWNVVNEAPLLEKVINTFNSYNIRTSLFIDPVHFTDLEFESLLQLKPQRIELYTEEFANDFATQRQDSTTEKYNHWATKCLDHGISVNAGHDLNQSNLAYFLKSVPAVTEVSIGHALFSEALYQGIDKTIENYLKICSQ